MCIGGRGFGPYRKSDEERTREGYFLGRVRSIELHINIPYRVPFMGEKKVSWNVL